MAILCQAAPPDLHRKNLKLEFKLGRVSPVAITILKIFCLAFYSTTSQSSLTACMSLSPGSTHPYKRNLYCRYPSTRTWLKGNRGCHTSYQSYVQQLFFNK